MSSLKPNNTNVVNARDHSVVHALAYVCDDDTSDLVIAIVMVLVMVLVLAVIVVVMGVIVVVVVAGAAAQ